MNSKYIFIFVMSLIIGSAFVVFINSDSEVEVTTVPETTTTVPDNNNYCSRDNNNYCSRDNNYCSRDNNYCSRDNNILLFQRQQLLLFQRQQLLLFQRQHKGMKNLYRLLTKQNRLPDAYKVNILILLDLKEKSK